MPMLWIDNCKELQSESGVVSKHGEYSEIIKQINDWCKRESIGEYINHPYAFYVDHDLEDGVENSVGWSVKNVGEADRLMYHLMFAGVDLTTEKSKFTFTSNRLGVEIPFGMIGTVESIRAAASILKKARII